MDIEEDQISVERILEELPEKDVTGKYFIILYESRPLQVIPPECGGPHLPIFSTKRAAKKFIRNRRSYFGEEPLSVISIHSTSIIHKILLAPSSDSRYESPPCGLILNFSYETQTYDHILIPDEVEEISGDELALQLGEESPSVEPIDQVTPVIVSDSSKDIIQEDEILQVERAEEQVKPKTQKHPYKLVIVAGGILAVLIVILGLFVGITLPEIRERAILTKVVGTITSQERSTQTAAAFVVPTIPPTTVPENVLILADDFSNPYSGWEIFDVEGAGARYNTGEYSIVLKNQVWLAFGEYPLRLSDLEIEVSARQSEGPDNYNTAYGVLCRIQPNYDAYHFLISGDGYFTITKFIGDDLISLIEWTSSRTIKQGTATNEIKAVCDGDYLALHVNGELLGEVRDSNLAQGTFGLIAGTFEEVSTEIRFDDFAVYAPYLGEPPAKICLVTDIGMIDDMSFNAEAWKGILAAMAKLGVEGKYLESRTAADYQTNIEKLVEDDCDLIVTVGFLLSEATEQASIEHPTTKFTLTDFAWDSPGDNLLGQVFAVDQAAFLAGYLSAGMTKTGKVGTFGGIAIPPITVFMDGYAMGVEHYNRVHGTNVAVLGWDVETQAGIFVGNFESVDDGRLVANDLLSKGADIIFPVAGPVGLGAAEAVQEHGAAYLIGMDTDWRFSAPGYGNVILTSVVKRFDVSVFDAVKQVVEGTFSGGVYVGTLENGGVDISPFGTSLYEIPPDLLQELEYLREDVISGSVQTLP